ncbi:MAG: HEPN domain-containing protein [Candidatus Kapaibacterium sp.]
MDYAEWIRMAETDRRAVANLLAASDKLWSVITFHAQLAAEKYLKGYLAFRGQELEKIHNMVALLEKAMKFDETLELLDRDCEHLSYFSVEARYPEYEESYTESVAMDAIAASDRICTALRERMQ